MRGHDDQNSGSELTRRGFIAAAGAAGMANLAFTPPPAATRTQQYLPPLDRPAGSPEAVARDERYWRRVAAYSQIDTEYTNTDMVNRSRSYYARRGYAGDVAEARRRVAEYIGARPTEVALTRGATEALQRLIIQYRGVGGVGSSSSSECWR
jgi:hypothetical protein